VLQSWGAKEAGGPKSKMAGDHRGIKSKIKSGFKGFRSAGCSLMGRCLGGFRHTGGVVRTEEPDFSAMDQETERIIAASQARLARNRLLLQEEARHLRDTECGECGGYEGSELRSSGSQSMLATPPTLRSRVSEASSATMHSLHQTVDALQLSSSDEYEEDDRIRVCLEVGWGEDSRPQGLTPRGGSSSAFMMMPAPSEPGQTYLGQQDPGEPESRFFEGPHDLQDNGDEDDDERPQVRHGGQTEGPKRLSGRRLRGADGGPSAPQSQGPSKRTETYDTDLMLAMMLQEEEDIAEQRAMMDVKPAFVGVRHYEDLPSFEMTMEQLAGSADENGQCMICINDFEVGEKIRLLPCLHRFHCNCIDPWLQESQYCPGCKLSVWTGQPQEPTPVRRQQRTRYHLNASSTRSALHPPKS